MKINDSHVKPGVVQNKIKRRSPFKIHLIDYCDPTVLIMYDKQTTISYFATLHIFINLFYLDGKYTSIIEGENSSQ